MYRNLRERNYVLSGVESYSLFRASTLLEDIEAVGEVFRELRLDFPALNQTRIHGVLMTRNRPQRKRKHDKEKLYRTFNGSFAGLALFRQLRPISCDS